MKNNIPAKYDAKYNTEELLRKLQATENDYYLYTYDSGNYVLYKWLDYAQAYNLVEYLAERGNEIAKRYISTRNIDDYVFYGVDVLATMSWKHTLSNSMGDLPNKYLMASNVVKKLGFEPSPTQFDKYYTALCKQILTANPEVDVFSLKAKLESRSARNWRHVADVLANTVFKDFN